LRESKGTARILFPRPRNQDDNEQQLTGDEYFFNPTSQLTNPNSPLLSLSKLQYDIDERQLQWNVFNS
jgi:hypothetical protein